MRNKRLNYRAILKILGTILLIISISMVPALICAAKFNESAVQRGLTLSMIFTFIVGLILFTTMKLVKTIFRAREGYLTVAVCWIIASLFGTLPYILSGHTDSFADALFESAAGFTTTGASVLDIDTFPKGLLMWKAISNWMGGMGILIFVISVFPALGINGQVIAKLETPAPTLEKTTIRMTDTAKSLYLIYIFFTVTEFLLLELSNEMSTFDAIVNSLSSISTAGLYCHSEGLSYYNSIFVEIIISVFAILGSMNFILFSYASKGNWQMLKKDLELRSFFKILFAAIVLCFFGLWLIGEHSFLDSLRYSFGQVISFMTTSGYTITDYHVWPAVCQMVFLTLLFIGGCAASTSGSIKVIRIVIMLKYIHRGLYKRLHPRAVVELKLKGQAIPPPVVSGISVFILSYMGIFLLACFVLSLQGFSLQTTISTAAGILSNTGIFFGETGMVFSNFAIFAPPLRIFMSLLMIIGRLELFTIIVLLTRTFWRKSNG